VNRRSIILLLCVLVMAMILVLAASMHDVRFEPGRSLDSAPTSRTSVPPLTLPIRADTPIWKIVVLWLAFVLNLVLFFLLLPPEVRKRILRQVISFAIGVLVLLFALRYQVLQVPALLLDPQAPSDSAVQQPGAAADIAPFQRPEVTPWVTFLISLAVLWAALLALWLAYRWWRRKQAMGSASLAAIADIARSSLDELASGRQWGDVVIETYARMSDAVNTQRGLQRGATMTAREFADHLAHAGLPADSVGGLTRLFEGVRYGGRASSERDVREAVACLESILRACGAPA
jgi:Domain of unknown function (DUF4129)